MIYIFLAEGFEELEVINIMDVLRRADIDVKSVSTTGTEVVEGTHGIKMISDLLFENADYENCEMIVLPGGLPGVDNLKAHKGLSKLIDGFAQKGKKIGAICAAPMILGGHIPLANKTATIYPGMGDKLGNMIFIDAEIIQDSNVITAKGPAFAIEFALKIVENMKNAHVADEVARDMLYVRE